MTDRELMKQALEALEEINKLSIGENAICLPAEIDGAMDALRERLAQPGQWQGLTYEEIQIVASKKWWDWEDAFDIEGFSRAIERVLKEKNT